MRFRLVSNSVTLNDLERRNRPNSCVIPPNSVAFWADCVKIVEDTRILSAGGYWQGITPSDSIEVSHTPLASENLTNNQP